MLPSLLQIKATKIAKLDKTLTVECLETKMCNETTAIILWVMLRNDSNMLRKILYTL